MEHPNWFEAITSHPETLNALLAVGGVFVGLALLFWVRKLAVLVVNIVVLFLGVAIVLIAVFGPILGLVPEPAPVAKEVYEQTSEGIDRLKQGAEILDYVTPSNSDGAESGAESDAETSPTYPSNGTSEGAGTGEISSEDAFEPPESANQPALEDRQREQHRFHPPRN